MLTTIQTSVKDHSANTPLQEKLQPEDNQIIERNKSLTNRCTSLISEINKIATEENLPVALHDQIVTLHKEMQGEDEKIYESCCVFHRSIVNQNHSLILLAMNKVKELSEYNLKDLPKKVAANIELLQKLAFELGFMNGFFLTIADQYEKALTQNKEEINQLQSKLLKVFEMQKKISLEMIVTGGEYLKTLKIIKDKL